MPFRIVFEAVYGSLKLFECISLSNAKRWCLATDEETMKDGMKWMSHWCYRHLSATGDENGNNEQVGNFIFIVYTEYVQASPHTHTRCDAMHLPLAYWNA